MPNAVNWLPVSRLYSGDSSHCVWGAQLGYGWDQTRVCVVEVMMVRIVITFTRWATRQTTSKHRVRQTRRVSHFWWLIVSCDLVTWRSLGEFLFASKGLYVLILKQLLCCDRNVTQCLCLFGIIALITLFRLVFVSGAETNSAWLIDCYRSNGRCGVFDLDSLKRMITVCRFCCVCRNSIWFVANVVDGVLFVWRALIITNP